MPHAIDIPADLDSAEIRPLLEALTEEARQFVYGYHECAFWATTDTDPDTGNESVPCDDIDGKGWDVDAAKELIADCIAFVDGNRADLELATADRGWSSVGHDFFLSRNSHGAGFFDRGEGAHWDRLQEAAEVYGTSEPYIGDDRKWYLHG